MDETEVRDIFARASNIDKTKKGFYTPDEWAEMKRNDGTRIFARKVLGLFKWRTTKSLDELAEVLHQIGISPSVEDGKKLMPAIASSRTVTYGNRHIDFVPVKNAQGQEAYRISGGLAVSGYYCDY